MPMKVSELKSLIDIATQNDEMLVELHVNWEYESQIVSVFVNNNGILVLSDVDAEKSVKLTPGKAKV
jgi:hypothetical protein